MSEVFELLYEMLSICFGYFGILFQEFEMAPFLIGVLFVVLAGRLLLSPIFSKGGKGL